MGQFHAEFGTISGIVLVFKDAEQKCNAFCLEALQELTEEAFTLNKGGAPYIIDSITGWCLYI
jgi:hypothetical protein